MLYIHTIHPLFFSYFDKYGAFLCNKRDNMEAALSDVIFILHIAPSKQKMDGFNVSFIDYTTKTDVLSFKLLAAPHIAVKLSECSMYFFALSFLYL